MALDDLVILLPAKGIKPVADQGRGRVAHSYRDFPLLDQLFWPGLRGAKPGCLAIPIGAAPIWPQKGQTDPLPGATAADPHQFNNLLRFRIELPIINMM